MKPEINICWLRRDLRVDDNAAIYHALKSEHPVMLLFIFDQTILEKLDNKQDARVNFLHQTLTELGNNLQKNQGTSILIKYGKPIEVWAELCENYQIKAVYANHDYEPDAIKRDAAISEQLQLKNIKFYSYKDQVIFEKNEITKSDGHPYTVFTPYYRQWQLKLNSFYSSAYPTERYFQNFWSTAPFPIPSLKEIGFEISTPQFPGKDFEDKLEGYEKSRDFPAADATSHIGIHLRFGTISIRKAVRAALEQKADKWLSELAWRDFYQMILWHFPQTAVRSFKPKYDHIQWRNRPEEFEAWCQGNTGYPLVDAGMRQLNATGYMHNRVRMVVASFLCKHLLIDWRWGEAYFAAKLLDYEMASNVGGWQWACGSGNDAAPYFRVFNPELQMKKFDPKLAYVDHWVPAYKQLKHVQPIVDHAFARERVLKAFKAALNE
ncbi:cryptochrome/photolyase family protein [Pedobacter gandavensis]|uniref:Deoxyribodipyrimidine photo-lyase n=1 Tax=Pedobacter gandavensis TaxID=2679963 RepID=A0ABR6EXQ4_9SPHI|nr:deoxyribodipyrimidine photo-lyase [Pedobacter gandavensis]MBB2149746.1 deoxyribodipyrimidine photo-lyase [Pedobacter gandavensis]